MNSSNRVVGTIVLLAIGAVAWLVFSGKDSEDGNSLDHTSELRPALEERRASSGPVPQNVADLQSGRAAEGLPTEDISPITTEESWPASVQRFMERVDPDPALSKELEFQIQRYIGLLATGGFDPPAIQCRGPECQLFFVGRSPPSGDASIPRLKPMLEALTNDPFEILPPARNCLRQG
jgi:hypothetical protein